MSVFAGKTAPLLPGLLMIELITQVLLSYGVVCAVLVGLTVVFPSLMGDR